MNIEFNNGKIKIFARPLLLCIFALSVASFWMGYNELIYIIKGKSVWANIIGIKTIYNDGKFYDRRLIIKYTGTADDGYVVSGEDTTKGNSIGKYAIVTYIEGDESLNILTDNRSKRWLYVFLILVAAGVIVARIIWVRQLQGHQASKIVFLSKQKRIFILSGLLLLILTWIFTPGFVEGYYSDWNKKIYGHGNRFIEGIHSEIRGPLYQLEWNIRAYSDLIDWEYSIMQ